MRGPRGACGKMIIAALESADLLVAREKRTEGSGASAPDTD